MRKTDPNSPSAFQPQPWIWFIGFPIFNFTLWFQVSLTVDYGGAVFGTSRCLVQIQQSGSSFAALHRSVTLLVQLEETANDDEIVVYYYFNLI